MQRSPTIFSSFINDIYTPCIKLGIPPSVIHASIKDITDFLLHPNRQGDICFSSHLQNKSNRHFGNKLSTNRNPRKTIDSQLIYLYNIEKPEISKISDAKKEILQYECNAPGDSHDRKYVEPRDICHPLTATGTGSMSSSLSAFTKRKYQPSSL